MSKTLRFVSKRMRDVSKIVYTKNIIKKYNKISLHIFVSLSILLLDILKNTGKFHLNIGVHED